MIDLGHPETLYAMMDDFPTMEVVGGVGQHVQITRKQIVCIGQWLRHGHELGPLTRDDHTGRLKILWY